MTELSVELRHAKRSNKKSLSLSRRELAFIPKEIFSIKTLEELDLSENKITAIEPNICELARLKVINLEGNLISDLPEEVMQLGQLEVLKVKGNPLGKAFTSLFNLRFGENLLDALARCFEVHYSPAKMRIGSKGKAETPSWLIETEQKIERKEQKIVSFKSISEIKSNYGRRIIKYQQQLEIQPQRQSINGVLLLKMSDFTIGEEISKGPSIINRGKYFDFDVAIKRLLSSSEDEELSDFKNQVNMLAKYRHPNIILMLGALTTPPEYLLIMEYVTDGTLHDLLHTKRVNLSDFDKRRIAIQLITVISYLQRVGIVHGDLRSKNVLIDKGYTIKLSGFGRARHRSQLNGRQIDNKKGSFTYMAQELLSKRYYNEKVDIFALGTLLYQLYANEIPYKGLEEGQIKEKVLKDSSLPLKISVKRSIIDMINRCRSFQLEQRPNCNDLLKFNDW